MHLLLRIYCALPVCVVKLGFRSRMTPRMAPKNTHTKSKNTHIHTYNFSCEGALSSKSPGHPAQPTPAPAAGVVARPGRAALRVAELRVPRKLAHARAQALVAHQRRHVLQRGALSAACPGERPQGRQVYPRKALKPAGAMVGQRAACKHALPGPWQAAHSALAPRSGHKAGRTTHSGNRNLRPPWGRQRETSTMLSLGPGWRAARPARAPL